MQAEIPLQGPPGPAKNEEIFLPFESHAKLLIWLKRLSIAAFPLALYQISAGFFLTSQHPSSLNSSLSFAGIFSFAFLSFVLYWTFITTVKEEKTHSLYQKTKDQLSSFALLIISAVKLAQIPVLLANLYFQRNYITDLITAQKSITSPWDPIQQSTSDLNNGMMVAYAITEGIFFLYTLFTIITLSRFSLKPNKICSIFIFVFNAILVGASLSLAFTAYRTWTPQNYPRFDSLFPQSMVLSLLGLGALSAILTLPVWLINHKKWRVGFFAGFLLTLAAGLLLISFSNSAYSQSQNIYQTYKNTENSREWSLNMGLVSQKEIEAAGCPSKYVSQDFCENDSIISAWESASTNGIRPYCLNKQCAGILGQLYADQFLHISNLSFITAIVSLLLSVGMLYSLRTRGRGDNSKQRVKGRHNKWLFTLFVVGLCVTLMYGFTPNDSIEEFKDSQNYADQANSGESDYLNWINAATGVMNKAGLISASNSADVESAIAQMMTARTDRFLIMSQDSEANNNKLLLTKRGGNDQAYDRFLENLSPNEPQIALVQVPIDDKEMLIEVIWTPENAPVERNNQLLEQYAKDSRGIFYNENLKMMVMTASRPEQLRLDALHSQLPSLTELTKAYNQVSDEIIEGTEKQISYITRRIQSDLTLETQSAGDIASMIRDRKYKFLVFELNESTETMAISQRGDWGGDYNDLVKSMNPNKPQIAIVFLRLDGTVKLAEILYLPESASDLEKQLFTEYYVNKNSAEAQEVGLETFVARNYKQLELQETLFPLQQEGISGNVFDLTKDQGKGKSYFFREDIKSEFERFLKEEGEKSYKYIILRWTNENEVGIERIGSVWKNYNWFLYDLHAEAANSPRLVFYNVEIEGESYPMMLLWFPEGQVDGMMKERFRSMVEEFEGKTSGYIISGENQLSIQDIVGYLANANKIKETSALRMKNQDRGLLEQNAPNMAFMKTPKMMPTGVTFLTTVEDWDEQLSLQMGRPMTLDQPGTPRILEVDERALFVPPIDFLRAPAAWAPPVFYISYLRAPSATRPPVDELRAKSAMAPPSLTELRAKGAVAPPPLTELRAPSATAPPVEELRAKSALAPPPLTELRAPSATAPPVDELRAPSATRPPVDELRAPSATAPPVDELRAKGALAPPPLTELRAPSATAPPVDELRAPSATRPPVDELRAPSATAPPADSFLTELRAPSATRPPVDELRAKSALAPPLTELRAPSATTPPVDGFLTELRAPSATRPPVDELRAPSATAPPVDELRAKGALAPPPLTELRAPSAIAPPIEELRAKGAMAPPSLTEFRAPSATAPPIDEFRAPSATAPPVDGFLTELRAPSATRPPVDGLRAPNAIRPPVDTLRAPGALRPPSQYLKISSPYNPPLSYLQSSKSYSSNDILSLFGASSSPPNFMLKSSSALTELWTPPFLSESQSNQMNSIPHTLDESSFKSSPLKFLPTFQGTELFDFFDDFALNSTNKSSIHVADGVNTTIQDMIANHKYSYVIIGLDASLTNLSIIEQGKAANSYEAFLQKFNKDRSQIAMIDLSVENTSKFVLIIYVPDSASQSEKEAFDKYIVPQASIFTKNQGVPVLIARTVQETKLANLLKYAFSVPQDTTTQNQPTLLRRRGIQGSQQRISPVVFHLKAQYIAEDVESILNEIVVGRKYKYVLLDWNTTTQLLEATKRAPKNASYDEFLKEFQAGKSRLALLDFGYEGKDIPILISWGSELVYSQPWQAQAYQLLLTEATNLNIPYYEPRELTSLKLPNLVDYLFTFWPLQINSYTKYTSNQLLSVLQNSPDSGTLESILKPIYPDKNSNGESVLTEMLLRRKYKYLLFKEVEESGDSQLLFVKNAPQSSTTQDFLNDINGNGNQLALLYLEFAGQDKIIALVMTDPATLEKNYINYARIASAAEVYDIPTAYVSSPEALDIEQLTQFAFADDILRILETLKVDTGVQDYWAAAQNGTSSRGYVIIRLQDNNSKIKIEKSKFGAKVTYADFQKELNTKKPFWSILNTADMDQKAGSSKARLISWIPSDTDMASKILYKNAENILVTSLPGSKVYSNPDLIPN